MRRTTIATAVVLIASGAFAQTAQLAVRDADVLLDVLVWGTYAVRTVDPAAYPPGVRGELQAHLRRADAYQSKRPVPAGSERKMVHSAQVGYERRLAAVTADAAAPSLAAAYVSALKPCYEWEGFHECPEREAIFADDYIAAHPKGPFAAFLPLLSAHRWLCAAEGYDYEKRSEDAARSRREYESRVAVAQASPLLLLRTAAARLAARGTCRADGGRAG
jgi:hypothetical protein